MLAAPLLDALHGGVEGYRFGVAIGPDKLPKSARFLDNAALAQWLASWSVSGYDVYHSCALFGGVDKVRRTTEHALGARALWVGRFRPNASTTSDPTW